MRKGLFRTGSPDLLGHQPQNPQGTVERYFARTVTAYHGAEIRPVQLLPPNASILLLRFRKVVVTDSSHGERRAMPSKL